MKRKKQQQEVGAVYPFVYILILTLSTHTHTLSCTHTQTVSVATGQQCSRVNSDPLQLLHQLHRVPVQLRERVKLDQHMQVRVLREDIVMAGNVKQLLEVPGNQLLLKEEG